MDMNEFNEAFQQMLEEMKNEIIFLSSYDDQLNNIDDIPQQGNPKPRDELLKTSGGNQLPTTFNTITDNNISSVYSSTFRSRKTRILPDGSTESEETVRNSDGTQETRITLCDPLRNCKTTIRRLLADGTTTITEEEDGSTINNINSDHGHSSDVVIVPVERSGMFDRFRSLTGRFWPPY